MKNKVIIGFAVAVGVLVFVSGGGSYDGFKNKTLGEFKGEPITAKKDIVEGYVSESGLPIDILDDVYACISQMSYTKSKDVQFSEAAGWCKEAYENEFLDRYISFDNFEKQFSPYDGAFRPLEKALKNSIGDKDSYEHVSSKFRLVMDGAPYALVETTFRVNNNQGVKVKNSVTAKVDILSGEMVGIQQ
ncbi:hypothetical protein RJD38_21995 (plasmid) [Vibrio scophthalmi]|uniref:hypothetical protein n=1 Tax=Vibrio scophthalmi TaxID=45658 RepID=UPI00349F5494